MKPYEVLDAIQRIVYSVRIDERQMDPEPLQALWHQLNELQIHTQLMIGYLNYQGNDQLADEFVEVVNESELIVDLSGWKIDAGDPNQVFIFPKGYLLTAQSRARIYTAPREGELSFDHKRPIWNNNGDVAQLIDPDGEVCSEYRYNGTAENSLCISHIHYDGQEFRSEGDEFIELVNISAAVLDLGGWSVLSERNKKQFVFPEQSIVRPYHSIRVYTNKPDCGPDEFSFDSPTAVWNNHGDCGVLLNRQGQTVVSYQY
ncbi:lamin tail domain-containing protein [Celerinatantimonas sp. YJH-8]|uniref:lamin tail domain-containing protein n=1 Tax=Celerinatantimonas sp. YJH-8 TaxID=3228714 RepID=UPI0038C0462F